MTNFGEHSSIADTPPRDERKSSVKGAFLQKGKVSSTAENEVSRFPPISEEEENKAIPEESGPGSGNVSRNNDGAIKRDSAS